LFDRVEVVVNNAFLKLHASDDGTVNPLVALASATIIEEDEGDMGGIQMSVLSVERKQSTPSASHETKTENPPLGIQETRPPNPLHSSATELDGSLQPASSDLKLTFGTLDNSDSSNGISTPSGSEDSEVTVSESDEE
jgi:hypothetical protein